MIEQTAWAAAVCAKEGTIGEILDDGRRNLSIWAIIGGTVFGVRWLLSGGECAAV